MRSSSLSASTWNRVSDQATLRQSSEYVLSGEDHWDRSKPVVRGCRGCGVVRVGSIDWHVVRAVASMLHRSADRSDKQLAGLCLEKLTSGACMSLDGSRGPRSRPLGGCGLRVKRERLTPAKILRCKFSGLDGKVEQTSCQSCCSHSTSSALQLRCNWSPKCTALRLPYLCCTSTCSC